MSKNLQKKAENPPKKTPPSSLRLQDLAQKNKSSSEPSSEEELSSMEKNNAASLEKSSPSQPSSKKNNDSPSTEPSAIEALLNEPISPTAIHLLRTIHSHNVELSSVADRKANFLLGATFISLSIVMSTGVKDMPFTLTILLVFSMLVAILAVLAIVPKYRISKDIPHHHCLFFFGSFAQRSFDDFYEDVDKVIRSEDLTHEALCRDIYGIGKVLMEKKFFYLSLSYRVFLIALIIIPCAMFMEKNL